MDTSIKLDLSLSIPAAPYSIESAVDLILKIHRQLECIEDYRLKLKWWMGFVMAHIDVPRGSRTESVDLVVARLRSERGIQASKTVLYQCARLYEVLSGDYLKYLHWIETRKRAFGRPVYWYDVVNDILGGRNNPDVIGEEAADEVDYRDVERAMLAFDNLIERAAAGNEEAAGVLEAYRQSLASLVFLERTSNTIPRSDVYLQFVSSHGCIVCRGPSDAHHALGKRGVGIKPSDFGTVPLCRRHHDELHRVGRRSFELVHRVSLAETALNLLHRFITGTWITMQLTTFRSSGVTTAA